MRPRNYKLDKEERELLSAYESGQLKSVPNVEAEKARITQLVRNHLARQRMANQPIVNIDYETHHSIQSSQL